MGCAARKPMRLTLICSVMTSAVSPLSLANVSQSAATSGSALSAHTMPARCTSLGASGEDGEFKRKDVAWRDWVRADKDSKFPAEKDRYHLYVAYACPYAHRSLITRALKGLEDAISITVVHPTWQKTRPGKDEHSGWVFGDPKAKPFRNAAGNGGPFPPMFTNNDPDPFVNAKSLRDVYEYAHDTDGKYSVPVLWDKKQKTIVSNDSGDIIRMLNYEFNAFAKNPGLDLYPEDLRGSIDEVNQWVDSTLYNGVFLCGFAKAQEAYDKAIGEVTDSFDRVNEILKKQRFIAGDRFTEADIRLFATLLRFDEVYTVYLKVNTRRVELAPAILNYCREIYQMPGVKGTVNMEQIKTSYYSSHPVLNTYSVIPRGPNFLAMLEQPHDRHRVGLKKRRRFLWFLA